LSTTTPVSKGKAETPSLEDDIRELLVLQKELRALQSLIAEKKKQIHAHVRQEAQNFSQELGECDGVSCIIKTIAHKAHGAWKIVSVHLKSIHQSKEMGSAEEAFAKAHGHTAQVAQMSGSHLRVESSTPEVHEAKAVCVSLLLLIKGTVSIRY
jgi:selenocysteine lyase/cysteine desulfurase